MKLLIITQKVDREDSVLGFFHSWLFEFAKYFEKIIVICLEKGDYDLPGNIKVLSLGKEEYLRHPRVIRRLVSLYRFYKYIWKERKNYEAVFIHMNPEYVILGGRLWRIMDKKINLWYVHRQLNWRIKKAAGIADMVFSVSENTFPVKTEKLQVMGHGIDMEKFKCSDRKTLKLGEKIRIISAGRITRIKNLDILIKAAKIIKDRIGSKFIVDIIGAPSTKKDENYQLMLQGLMRSESVEDIVRMSGAAPYGQMAEIYCRNHILVNLCPTGGIDKAVLEAMACGIPAIVSNESFIPYFGDLDRRLIFKYRDENDLSAKIIDLTDNCNNSIGKFLREQVEKHHNLKILIKKLSEKIINGQKD
jgi:glycosyltransferase involved in cell wall biosynthesis